MAEPVCFILLVDKEVQGSASDSLLNQRHALSSKRILKGSLLQGYEVPPVGGQSYGDVVKGSNRADTKQFVVKPLSGDMQFQCSSWEIGRITVPERDLLRTIATNSDRFNIYQDMNLLPYALGLKEGSLVKVRHRNHSTSPYEEVAALVQYIGPLSETEMGTQFGLELMDDAYRGQGTSDGVLGKCRYFQTDPDCAVFVPISKLVPPSTSQGASYLYKNVSLSKQELPNQPSELTSVGDIKKGTTVYLQVGNGMRRGRVVYMIVPHKETEPHAVVEMPKQDGDRMWNGMHKGYHVYTPRNGVITTFVPVSDVTTHAPEASQAHKTDTSRVARSTTAASAAAPSRSESATGKGAAGTIPGASTLAEPTCFILLVDKEVQVSASDSLLDWRHTPFSKRILKGSLLQGHEVHVGMVGGLSYGDVVKGSKRADAKRFVVEPLSGDMQFQCSSLEIGRITGLERDLLRAISVNSDRFNIYQDSDLLPYAQGLKEGSLVKVRHRNDSVSPYEEVAALVRYIGPLSETKMGTQFGLELMDDAYRGQGTSDGIYGKCRYFQTDPDCAVFVPISKLVPPSTSQGASYLYENVPRSKQELPNQPSELTSVGDIKKGTTVYLQVGNSMRRGRVVYMIVPHKETEPYATVEMPKQDGDRMWNGMHKGYHVYTPRNGVITTFVPVSDVTTHAPEASQAHKTDTSRVARSTTAASAAAPSRSESATGKGAAGTIPGASTLAEPTCFILLVDKEVQVSTKNSQRLLASRS
ncbi:ubiquitin carboxyl-terminal hydrolase CYLD-like [Patiria miniata]|uniref:CAP-Gly domain-containing protein n=1 Tax=Patiria miniata TaxID=46514 RepID=A0A914AT19_PATMI|nr:ubiquitin carboxyl-terminal hydrolase CYLD-like [Patiria miniata]